MKTILILIFYLLTAISAFKSRIVGGEVAESTQFPFYCTLYGLNQDPNPSRCGASITTSNWVLTAAQCIHDNHEQLNNYQVHCGRWNLLETSEHEQIRTADLIIAHSNFDPNDFFATVYYDIALIRLSEPLIFNEYIQPILVAPGGYNPYYSNATMLGWDLDHLHYAYIPLISQEDCKNNQKVQIREINTTKSICTGPLTGGFCISSQDYGSPLVQKTVTGSIQIGIASWSIHPCGSPDSPSGFLAISYYYDWIINIINYNN